MCAILQQGISIYYTLLERDRQYVQDPEDIHRSVLIYDY